MDTLNKYLQDFNRNLLNNVGVNFTYVNLSNLIEKKKIKVDGLQHNYFRDEIEFSWLSELEIVTEKIMAIASNPRTHIKFEKEIKKAEQVVKIDNYDIIETLKLPKYWRKKDDEYLPEYLYTDQYEMEYAIYENRFIINLIDKMLQFLSRVISDLYEKVKKVNRNFIEHHVPVSDIDILQDIANFEKLSYASNNVARVNNKVQKNIKLLTTKDSPYVEALKRVLEAKKTLSHVLSTPFYKIVKKSKRLSDADVHITNMLAGDKRYSPCYNFYLKLLTIDSSFRVDDEPVAIKDYHNYVLLNLFHAFEDIGFTATSKMATLTSKDQLIIAKKISFKKDEIVCKINSDSEDHIDLLFEIKFKTMKTENMALKKTSKVSIDLLPSTNIEYSSEEELEPYFKKKIAHRLAHGYTNAFIVTTVDNTQKEDVIICSPYVYKIDANVRSMIESCIIFSEGDSYVYSHLCPVCGYYVDGEQEDGNCYCTNCDSVYALFTKGNKKDNKESVWIKRIKNPEKI